MKTLQPKSQEGRQGIGQRILSGLADSISPSANPLSIRCLVCAALLYLLAALVFTYPLPLLAGSAVDNIGDPLLNTWILAWDWHALTTRPLDLFNANIFYPNQNTLAYSENLVFPALLAAPVNALTGNPVLAHNFVLLLSFPLTALAAYALVGHLTGSRLGALTGGFIFAFAHYRLGQLSHLQLLPAFWLPLALLWLHRFAERPALRWAALVGLAVGLQWWTSIYFAFYLVIAAALFVVWAFAAGQVKPSRSALAGGLLAVAVAALLIAPGLKPYLDIGAEVGERTLGQQEGATLADYLRPGPRSLLGRALGLAGGRWEHTLFPGLVALGLAGIGLTRPKEASPEVNQKANSDDALPSANPVPIRWQPFTFYLLLAGVSLVLSFGPALLVTPDAPPLIQGMPYAWLYRAIPPLAALRVPARLVVLVMLSVAVLAGRGAAVLHRRLRNELRRREARAVGLRAPSIRPLETRFLEENGFLRISLRSLRLCVESLAIPALLALEYLALPAPHAPIETGAAVPPVYRWLAGQQFDGAIFELPTARTSNITDDQESIRRIVRQQYFSVYHWHPLVIGYSGTNAPTFKDVIDFAPAAASPVGLAWLRDLGVSRIVVHTGQMTWDEWATFAETAARQPDLAQVASVGDAVVYALAPQPAAAAQDRWQTANAAFAPGLRLAAYSLSGGQAYTAGEALLVRLRWQAQPADARGRGVSLQVVDGDGNKVSQSDYFFPEGQGWPDGEFVEQRSILSLPRDLPPGEYALRAILYQTADLAPVGQPATLAAFDVSQPSEFLIQHPLPARLGQMVELLGFDAGLAARPGEALPLTLYWRRLDAIADDYTVFVHLRRADGTVLAQQDNPPRLGTYPTRVWRAGETVLDRYTLTIPPDAAPGEYTLAAGMYLPGADERLPAYDAQGDLLPDGSLLLGTVEVASVP